MQNNFMYTWGGGLSIRKNFTSMLNLLEKKIPKPDTCCNPPSAKIDGILKSSSLSTPTQWNASREI